MTTPDTSIESAPRPDARLSIAKARNATLLCALLLLSFAALMYVAYRRNWSAQEGLDPAYANGGYVLFAGTAIFAALYVVIGAFLLARPNTLVIASATGTAWVGAVVLAALGVAGCIPGPDGPPRMLVMLIYFAPIPLVWMLLVVAHVRMIRQLSAAAHLVDAGLRIRWAGFLIPVAYAVIAAAIVLPSGRNFVSYRTANAVRAVWRVHGCAHRYAARNPARGFPDHEELFREERECLGPFASGRGPRFTVSYAPTERDSAGRVTNFLTRTRQRHLWMQRYESLAADAAGIVHIAYRRNATVDDHAAPFEVLTLRLYTGCIDHYKREHESKGYPIDWSVLQTENRCAVEPRVAPNVYERSGYRVSYQPLDPDSTTGYARGYVLHARPIVFGQTGVRSYYASNRSRKIHATAEDRDAHDGDPIMKDCEMEAASSPWQPCPQDPR